MKSIRNIIIVIAICIVIISILLVYLLLQMKSGRTHFIEENDTDFGVESAYEITEEFQKVSIRNKYFAVKNIIQSYVQNLQYINENESNDYTGIYKIIYNMLDLEYKKEMNISNYNDVKIPTQYTKFDLLIKDMYISEKSMSINMYVAYCKLGDKDLNLLIKTDSRNNTFSIFLEDYIQKHASSLQISNESILKNENNTFSYTNINNDEVALEYLNRYKYDAKYNIEKAYNQLDDEYKKMRFNNINDYTKYIKDNKEILETSYYLTSGVTTRKENITEYYCIDQYGMTYVFKEADFNDYTIMLDDYTLENEYFNETYEKVSNKEKGLLNCQKFFKMVNMQDYKSAYKLLDENFKQTYFKTQAEFESYIKNKLFQYNKATYKGYGNVTSNIHTFKVNLTDATEQKTNTVEFNIVMQLLEGTNFTMSFEVN